MQPTGRHRRTLATAAALVLTAAALAARLEPGGRILLGDGGRRAPVVFDHGRHTRALAAGGGPNCDLCHARHPDGRLLLTAVAADAPPAARRAAHRRCGDCHERTGRGPHLALCAACHDDRATDVPAPRGRGMAAFDHAAHLAVLDDACGRCHHVADPVTGRPAPGVGEHAACADCHGAAGMRTPLRQAAHGSCVTCHERAGGPVACADCHGT